jgi:hypothetical protein
MRGAAPLLAWLAMIAVAAAAQQRDPPAKSSLQSQGMLNKLQPHLEQIFQFTFDGPRLKLERKSWGETPKVRPGVNQPATIESIFNQLRSSAGVIRSMGIHASDRYREVHFSGTAMGGRLHTRGDYVRMELEEIAAPQRTLEWLDDGLGGMRLMLSNADGELLLLQQSKQGAASVAGVFAGKSFAANGESFLAMYKQHRTTMDAQVLPVMEALAIRLIPSPQTPEMKKAVIALLTRTPESLAEGKKLLADLDHEKFQMRDKASRMLNERFEVYKDLIQEKLKASTLSPEASSRLHKILAAHPESDKVSQTIAALDLQRDPAYLVSLLAEVGAGDRRRLISHLEAVTGQRLGDDPAAWQRWLADRQKR